MKRNSILDERYMSWKVLLPTNPVSRVLALGLEDGQLSSLARSYDYLDTELADGIEYDIIILGNNIGEYTHSVNCLVSKVRADGMVVNIGSDNISRQLKESGFKYCRQYAGLPAHQPRLYIPLGSALLRAKGISFHKPGSLKAKMALSLAKCLSRLGIKFHLMKNTVSIFAADKQILNNDGIINWISNQVGYEIVDLVIYGGSDSDRRKITALAIAGNGNQDVVVKIADTQLATEAVKQEAEALQAGANSPIANCVPKVIGEGFCGSYYLQIQEKLNSTGRQISSLTDAHIEFLAELSMVNRRECLLKETSLWQKLNAQAGNINNLSMEVEAAAKHVLSKASANTKFFCHSSHGDFAPWNISFDNGKLFIYDWEDSLRDGLPFSDIFHFIYRQAALVGPWQGAEKIVRQMFEHAGRLTGNSVDNIKLSLSVWALNEYINHPCKEIEEILHSKELKV